MPMNISIKSKGLDTGRIPECGLRERQSGALRQCFWKCGIISTVPRKITADSCRLFTGRKNLPPMALYSRMVTVRSIMKNVGENIYLNIINRAKNYVYIFTPYLIIDHEMLICLSNAAKSGVDVRIVTPGVPDKKAVYLLTQSYYEPLLKNGVKIFQYTPGFIHAKCFVCDDEIATVGSVNLDYRSLFLHFECGVFMYRSKAVMQVKEDCLRTFEESEEMDVSFCRRRRLPVRMVQSLMRLFAPLL